MALMARYPDKYFDLAVVDPPYGINVNNNMGRRRGNKPSKHKVVLWDDCSPNTDYFTELFRVSKNQIIWGANHFISKMPFNSSCWLLWDKGFSCDVSFAQFELAFTSFTGTCKKYDKSPNQSDRIHPTQKPVALYDWIFQNYAKEGDKILDTHLGSGSSRIAAHKNKLDFTACELDAEYFEAQERRFETYTSQLQLF
jgi:site-specific DNA-methyltransferase (adenine-specific)